MGCLGPDKDDNFRSQMKPEKWLNGLVACQKNVNEDSWARRRAAWISFQWPRCLWLNHNWDRYSGAGHQTSSRQPGPQLVRHNIKPGKESKKEMKTVRQTMHLVWPPKVEQCCETLRLPSFCKLRIHRIPTGLKLNLWLVSNRCAWWLMEMLILKSHARWVVGRSVVADTIVDAKVDTIVDAKVDT